MKQQKRLLPILVGVMIAFGMMPMMAGVAFADESVGFLLSVCSYDKTNSADCAGGQYSITQYFGDFPLEYEPTYYGTNLTINAAELGQNSTQVTLAAHPDDGYVFSGWYKAEYVGGDAQISHPLDMSDPDNLLSSEQTYTLSINQNTYICAVFEQGHAVTFNANGHGTAPTTQMVANNGTVSNPGSLTAAGYTFGGWYKEAACTNAYDFSSKVTSDFTLYAKWTQEEANEPATIAPVADPITISKAPTKVKAKAKKGKVTVTWNTINLNKKGKALLKKIKNIQVQCSQDPSFARDTITTRVGKKKSTVKLKLKRKTTYFIRVRYVGNNGFSKWSSMKKVRTK